MEQLHDNLYQFQCLSHTISLGLTQNKQVKFEIQGLTDG